MCIKKTEKTASSDQKTAILGKYGAWDRYKETVNFDVSMGVELSRAKGRKSKTALKTAVCEASKVAAALARKRISRKGVCVKGFEALQFNAGKGKAGLVAMNLSLWGCGVRHLLANFTIATLVLVSGAAGATPGATDANGCHQSAKLGYHCHAKKPGKATERQADQRRTEEDRRLRRECKGRPNAGACLGYAS